VACPPPGSCALLPDSLFDSPVAQVGFVFFLIVAMLLTVKPLTRSCLEPQNVTEWPSACFCTPERQAGIWQDAVPQQWESC
jgi:hypothetical protein